LHSNEAFKNLQDLAEQLRERTRKGKAAAGGQGPVIQEEDTSVPENRTEWTRRLTTDVQPSVVLPLMDTEAQATEPSSSAATAAENQANIESLRQEINSMQDQLQTQHQLPTLKP
jgi:uncharacterized coiled-coil DUF342 family protein